MNFGAARIGQRSQIESFEFDSFKNGQGRDLARDEARSRGALRLIGARLWPLALLVSRIR